MIVAVAMVVHFALSIAYGVAIAWIVRRFQAGIALAVGAGLGLAIYLVNFYPIASAAFPWFAMARGWMSAVAHIIFGSVAAVSYVALRRSK
jgi:uncharacterized membrane protein YagU involved in acid resistance